MRTSSQVSCTQKVMDMDCETNNDSSNDGIPTEADLTFPMTVEVEEEEGPLFCPFTNRPYAEIDFERPPFWCGVCSVKLPFVTAAIQHMQGKQHRNKLAAASYQLMVTGNQSKPQVPGVPPVVAVKQPDSAFPNNSPPPPLMKPKPEISIPHAKKTYSEIHSIPDRGFGPKKLSEPSQPEAPVPSHEIPQILDLKCLLCEVNYDTMEAMESHLKEEDHMKKFREATRPPPPPKARCDVCDMEFTSSATRDIHYKGKKHLNRVKLQEEMHGANGESNRSDSPSVKTEIPLECKACKVKFNGVVCASAHFKSKKHAAQMQLLGDNVAPGVFGKRKFDGSFEDISQSKRFDEVGNGRGNISEEDVMNRWMGGDIGKSRPYGRGVSRARGRGGRGSRGIGRSSSNTPQASGYNIDAPPAPLMNITQPPAPLMNIAPFPKKNSFNPYASNSDTEALGKVKYRDRAGARPIFNQQNRKSNNTLALQQAILTNQVNEIHNLQNRLQSLQSGMPGYNNVPL